MYKTQINSKYKIGDEVEHRTKGSNVGLVTDFRYYAHYNAIEYQVAFAAIGGTSWFYDNELKLKTKHAKD